MRGSATGTSYGRSLEFRVSSPSWDTFKQSLYGSLCFKPLRGSSSGPSKILKLVVGLMYLTPMIKLRIEVFRNAFICYGFNYLGCCSVKFDRLSWT